MSIRGFSRRTFSATLFGLIPAFLVSKVLGPEAAEEKCDVFRLNDNGDWMLTDRRLLKPGDKVIHIGTTGGRLWRAQSLVLAENAYVPDLGDGMEGSEYVESHDLLTEKKWSMAEVRRRLELETTERTEPE
jgi:hypothetical protein